MLNALSSQVDGLKARVVTPVGNVDGPAVSAQAGAASTELASKIPCPKTSIEISREVLILIVVVYALVIH